MKVEAHINEFVEVEVSLDAVMAELCLLKPGDAVYQFNRGLSAFYRFLSAAPDELIVLLNDNQRKTIVDALRMQASRIESTVTKTNNGQG